MTISVNIFVIGGDGLSPVCSVFEVNMLDIGTSIDNVDVNTLATVGTVEVFVEGSEAEAVTVGYSGQAPRSILLSLPTLQSVNFRVFFDVINLVDHRTQSAKSCDDRAVIVTYQDSSKL